jgi:hypothetical protein
MTSKNIVQLTAITASVIFTVAALAMYSGGFAQKITGGQKQEAATNTAGETIDSVAYNKGLAELQRIIDHYSNASVMVNGEIRYYNNDSNAITPTENANFVFAVDGQKSLYELDSVATITNDDVAVVVDKREQSIAVVERGQVQEQSQKNMQPAPDMLTMMKESIKDIKVSQSGQLGQLTLYFSDEAPSNVIRYVIMYDAQTYSIKKMRIVMADAELEDALTADDIETMEDDELYFVDSSNNAIPTGMYAKAKMAVYEIVYGQERKLQKDALSISQYVKKSDDGYVPAGRYKNYSILN